MGCLGEEEESEMRVFCVMIQFWDNKTKYMTLPLPSIHTLSLPKLTHYVLFTQDPLISA